MSCLADDINGVSDSSRVTPRSSSHPGREKSDQNVVYG